MGFPRLAKGGIKDVNLHPSLLARLNPDQSAGFQGAAGIESNTRFQAQEVLMTGLQARNVLRVAANVAEGETVTIGSNVFEVDIINTDTTRTCAGLNNTTNPAQLTLSGAPGITIAAGDLLRIATEYFKVLRKISATVYVLARGRCGTTNAAHADGGAVFQSNSVPAGANIPVGLDVTLTPTVFTAALTAEINNALAGTERATAKASTIFDPGPLVQAQTGVSGSLDAGRIGKVIASNPSVNEVLVKSAIPENQVLATTETLAGASNAWQAATMAQGRANALKKTTTVVVVPTAQEVALGLIRVVLPFTPTYIGVEVRTTATGIIVAWNGGAVPVAGGITIDNTGAVDWSVNESLYIEASE